MRKLLAFVATAVVAMPLASTGADATVVVNASVGGMPTGAIHVNFDGLPLGTAGGTSGGVQVSFTGDGQVVTGFVINRYARPYLSNGNGAPFGDPSDGPDSTPYLSSGIGSVKIEFPGLEKHVGLLWGSVDPYNTLYLYKGSTLVGTVPGTDVWPGANGDQGVGGTFYVNITSTAAFDSIVAASSNYAFELDNVAYAAVSNRPVVEPLSLSLFAAGLAGLAGFAGRRRRRC